MICHLNIEPMVMARITLDSCYWDELLMVPPRIIMLRRWPFCSGGQRFVHVGGNVHLFRTLTAG